MSLDSHAAKGRAPPWRHTGVYTPLLSVCRLPIPHPNFICSSSGSHRHATTHAICPVCSPHARPTHPPLFYGEGLNCMLPSPRDGMAQPYRVFPWQHITPPLIPPCLQATTALLCWYLLPVWGYSHFPLTPPCFSPSCSGVRVGACPLCLRAVDGGGGLALMKALWAQCRISQEGFTNLVKWAHPIWHM